MKIASFDEDSVALPGTILSSLFGVAERWQVQLKPSHILDARLTDMRKYTHSFDCDGVSWIRVSVIESGVGHIPDTCNIAGVSSLHYGPQVDFVIIFH